VRNLEKHYPSSKVDTSFEEGCRDTCFLSTTCSRLRRRFVVRPYVVRRQVSTRRTLICWFPPKRGGGNVQLAVTYVHISFLIPRPPKETKTKPSLKDTEVPSCTIIYSTICRELTRALTNEGEGIDERWRKKKKYCESVTLPGDTFVMLSPFWNLDETTCQNTISCLGVAVILPGSFDLLHHEQFSNLLRFWSVTNQTSLYFSDLFTKFSSLYRLIHWILQSIFH
jgi:hypothetical protein